MDHQVLADEPRSVREAVGELLVGRREEQTRCSDPVRCAQHNVSRLQVTRGAG